MAELAQGYRGYAGFATQTADLVTGVAPAKFQTITKFGLKEERQNRDRIAGIRKNQGYNLATKGRISASGDISGPLIPDEAFQGYLLAQFMGNNNAVSGSGTVGYTHVFSQPTITTTANYPAYGSTINSNKGGTDTTLVSDFLGMFCNKLQYSFPEQGAQCDVTAGFVGTKETTGGTLASPTYSAIPPFESWMLTLSIGADLSSMSAVEIFDANVNLSNGAKMLPSTTSRYPAVRGFGLFDHTLDFSMFLRADLTVFNYWKNETEMAVKLVATHTTLAGGSSGYYTLQFEFPRVIFIGDVPNIEGAEEIKHKVSMKALQGTGSYAYSCKITSINSESGTYAV